ncbi:MAG TPA: Ig-like domain-containing protein [Chitinophagaceae bacterium]|nr:Ig-like domain-containing protein [Chitinophagaceae bacterium]
MKTGLIALVAVLAFAGCKKDKGDSIKPTINVTSPQANQQFNAGQVINIAATITDNSELYEVSLSVVNKATSAELVHNHYHSDQMSFNLNETMTAMATTTYKIKIQAADHSGNQSEIEFEVKGN